MRSFSEGIGFVNEVQRSGWEEAKGKFGMGEEEAKRWWEWYEREVCVPWVVYEGEGGLEEVVGSDEGEAEDLDKLPLVVRDLKEVRFGGKVYPLEGEGLYRFVVMTKSVRNLIVSRSDDPVPVLRALSSIQVHGNRDDGRDTEELKGLLLHRAFLCITCGTIASLTVSLLKDLGFRARFVSALTSEDWNTYDNGHGLCEVFLPGEGRWVLADVDMGFLFRGDGNLLSAYEFWERINEGREVEFVPLSEKFVDPFFSSPWGFNWFLRVRYMWRGSEGKKAWYRRIFQAVGIREGERTTFFGPEDKLRLYYGNEVEVVPRREWRERFYGG